MFTPTSTFFLFLAAALASPIQSPIVSCLSNSGLNIEISHSPNWTTSITPYNTRFNYTPAAIVYPTQTSDVSKAVLCAVKYGVHVSALSGGHSYSASGLGSRNGTVVLNMRKMTSVSRPTNDTVYVQPGARLGDMALELNNKYGLAMAHGLCPYVGVGGHAGFGGWGLASRNWGLLIDQVVGAKLVLANGTTTHVSQTENPDLFWGVRGASAAFGIVTQYTMKTHQAPASVIRYAFNFIDPEISPERFAKIIYASQVWGLTVEKEMGCVTNVWQGGKDIEVAGFYMGSLANFYRVTAPLLQATGPPNATYVQERDWITALTEAAGGTPLNTQGTPDIHDTFYAKSLVVPTYSPLTTDALSALAKYFTSISLPDPEGSWFIQFELWGGGNSEIWSVDPRSTAYPHRHHHWTCQFYGRTTGTWSSQATKWMNGLVDAVTDNMQGTQFGGYANYLDPELSGWKDKYYAGNYARLEKMQKEVDPMGVFMKRQNIGARDS
ncbi:glucooligosaccharide oxidase [Mycena galericulata]|nr:glucooligosaccharide oxidase [Mycena galericulata]